MQLALSIIALCCSSASVLIFLCVLIGRSTDRLMERELKELRHKERT